MKKIQTCEMVKLLVTEKCNMSCPFCTKPIKQKDEMSIDEILMLGNSYFEAGVKKIKISGGAYGEPLLRKDLEDIILGLKSIGYKSIGLATNGKLFTKDLSEKLNKAGLTWVTHSVTTLNPETYKNLYGGSYSDSYLDGFKTASLYERYQLNCVLLRNFNLNEIDTIVDFGHRNNSVVQFMELVENNDNKVFFSSNFYSAESFKASFYEKCLSYYYRKGEMRDVYELENGVVTIKQTRKDENACNSCKRYFISSNGANWFCNEKNVLFDLNSRAVLSDPNEIKKLIKNRHTNIILQKQLERFSKGCGNSVD